ncbi:sortase domain-bontaining protein [uncultured Microbacterium sp.]|uniref:sortase domain-containing protein n=1 Tax=uncultured Microbacterium sp. TaxID=191216 RepID=UPI0035CB39FF
MTALADAAPLQEGPPPTARGGRLARAAAAWVDAPPFSQAVGLLLGTLSASIIVLLVTLVLISPIQHFTAQTGLFDRFRLTLAEGSVPVGPVTNTGDIVDPGTPIAMFTAPAVSVSEEIIVQGTAGAETMQGIGHRRDTPLPCQPGTSVLMARAAAYGGVGGRWTQLQTGDQISVTTGQGTCTYTVTGQRRAGDPAPAAPTSGNGSLVLTTAAGLPFMPNEVLRIDAILTGTAFEAAADVLPSAALPPAEKAMAVDDSIGVLFGLVLLLELLVAAVIAATYAWRRWNAWQTWVFAVPVLAALAVITANAVNQLLLPNLL